MSKRSCAAAKSAAGAILRMARAELSSASPYTGGPGLKFLKVVYSGIHRRLMVPIGPFLCFATITSARFFISESLL